MMSAVCCSMRARDFGYTGLVVRGNSVEVRIREGSNLIRPSKILANCLSPSVEYSIPLPPGASM